MFLGCLELGILAKVAVLARNLDFPGVGGYLFLNQFLQFHFTAFKACPRDNESRIDWFLRLVLFGMRDELLNIRKRLHDLAEQ